jgi:hypothetical protein
VTDDQFFVIVALLGEIRDALVGAEIEEPAGCQHPDEQRVSLATPREPDHWVCAGCKYEHKGIATN